MQGHVPCKPGGNNNHRKPNPSIYTCHPKKDRIDHNIPVPLYLASFLRN
jgi:hypothetical protein